MKETKILFGIAVVLLLFSLVTGYHGSVAWTQAIIGASLLAFLVKAYLAVWIYLRNPSGKVNRYFAIVFMAQAIWDLGKFFMWLTTNENIAFIWAKISYSGYIISVFFLLGFVWAFLKKKNYFTTTPGKIVLYTPMVFLLVSLWFQGGVIADLAHPEELTYGFGVELWNYNYGFVYNYFFMWFQIIPFFYAFVLFVFKYFLTMREEKRKQLFYLVVGSAFPIMIGIPTGVILPMMGIQLPPHNNMLSLVMSIFIAIGIIKYKFLSITPVGEKIDSRRKLDHALAKEYEFGFGQSYFIKHEKSTDIAHNVLLTHLYKKRYGLIITAHNPAKIRRDYGIETTPIVWMTDTETEYLSVDPIDIEQLYETIRVFVEKVPQSFVLIDGLDYLLVHNNFTKILHFIKQVKATVVKNRSCLVIPKGALAIDPKQERLLEADSIILPLAKAKAAARAKEKERARKKVNYVVIGHTPLAQSIVSEFEKSNIKPTIIEKKEVLVHYPKGAVNIIKGDPLSRKVLEHAGVGKPNTVVLITLEEDSDVILCINKIRQLSDSTRIITNIHNQNFVPIAMKAGADKVIPSSSIGGRLISLALTSPDIVRWVMDATTLSAKELELTECRVERKSVFAGKTIKQIDGKLGKAGNIISVKTEEGLKQIPDDDYKMKEGDVVILVLNLKALPKGKGVFDRICKMVKIKK
jgi:Trk K+ transport system NAD-binding subunit